MLRAFALGVVAMASTVAAFAADIPAQTTDFANKVAVATKFEIDTSQLALETSKSQRVKDFANQMISDHQKAASDFKAALASASIEPPKDQLDVTHTAKYAKLRVFTTADSFDSAYIDAQIDAHKDAVATFKDYAANGPTPAVKSFAEKTLPTLEHHLSMIESLRNEVPKS